MASFLRVGLPLVSLLSCAIAGNVPPSPGDCPLHGPIFPVAQQLPNDPAFVEASKNISASLKQTLDSKLSVSVQIFDIQHTDPLFEHTSTSKHINTTLGVDKVDENTIFRIGSVSKLWTTLALLVERGIRPFSDPIVEYVPELLPACIAMKMNKTQSEDYIDWVPWCDLTVGDLASHLAGIARDYGFSDMSAQGPQLQQAGFPPLSPVEIPPCGTAAPCDRSQFFHGIMNSHPVVPTSSTPVYSNAGYQIIGYALEAMTGQRYNATIRKNLVERLGLRNTYVDTPDAKRGVIPDYMGEFYWNFQTGDEAPAASIYASTADVVNVGRAILNSTLLSPVTTRRWLQPASFTSDSGYGVGAPWEIVPLQSSRTVHFYTKSGDIGVYSAILALLPDHGVGFTVLAAGNDTHTTVASVADLISTTLLPALDESAKGEAKKRFDGTYHADQGLNSSVTITTDKGPGLAVTNWISNSTNMFESLASMQGLDPSKLSIRLYPTGLESPGQIAFRALIQQISPSDAKGRPFTAFCPTWMLLGTQIYGNIAVDEFVFALDAKGNAKSVSPRALRVSLPKT